MISKSTRGFPHYSRRLGIPAASICILLVCGAAIPAVSNAEVANSDAVQEVVITAEKRSATVQSTPISITAITGEQLAAQGTTSVEALAATTPGISMRTAGPGQTEFEMRGLASSGGAAPTVGFYLDETPLSPAAASLNGRAVIDPDLFDLNRVEVLRGPQGTLYGSGSMGGTIKLIANPPKLHQFESAVEAILSDTHGGGFNPGGNVMVNLPLGDTAALRLVGTEKYTDGYIDRVVVNPFPLPTNPCAGWAGYGCTRGDVTTAPVTQVIRKTNTEQLGAGRASLLFQPSSDLSMTTTLMYQRITAGGYNQYQEPPGAGVGLTIYQPYNLKEPVSDTFKLASETLTYDFDFAQLTSATNYWSREEDQSQDATEALQNLFALNDFLPVLYTEDDKSSQFSQELRLTSSGVGAWQWVGGLFFSNLHSTFITYNQSPAYAYLAVGGASADPQGLIYNANNPYGLKQYAVFGDVSYRLSSELKLTTGLRWYKYDTVEHYSQAGIATQSGTAQATTGAQSSSAKGYNPKVNLSYTPSADLTLYSTIARGFRPGGVSLPVPTAGLTVCPNVPLTYGPDSVWNYEVGEKARFLDNRLVINSDVYYIKWSQIQQIIELSCGYPYTANAGNASSYGPELEVTGKITSHLTVTATGAWTHSTIVHANPSTGIQDGTRVLNIPKETASLALNYDRPVLGNSHWISRLTGSFVGSEADIAFAPITLPSYTLIDLRSGIDRGVWSAYLFVDNLTDKHAALTVNNTSFAWQSPSITRVTTNQPRTVGVDLQYRF
jgi:iron complex outermembrane receptor protein